MIRNTSTHFHTRKSRPHQLDKLAQPLQTAPAKGSQRATLVKRARSKWFTRQILGPLLELGSPLEKQYENAWHCCEFIYVDEEGTARSRYCNSRVCNTCNRIRTAKAMNGYMSQLEGKETYFLTLTAPNVGGEFLRQEVRRLKNVFGNIRRVLQRQGMEFAGLTKTEITHNDQRQDFHPHLHILYYSDECNGQEVGEAIIDEWLKRNKNASRNAQDLQRADEGSRNELFKYTTKQLKKADGKGFKYDPVALDTIMRALYKLRTLQPFGGLKRVNDEVEGEELIAMDPVGVQLSAGYYMYHESDWYHVQDGHALTSYKPPNAVFYVQDSG